MKSMYMAISNCLGSTFEADEVCEPYGSGIMCDIADLPQSNSHIVAWQFDTKNETVVFNEDETDALIEKYGFPIPDTTGVENVVLIYLTVE